MLKSQLDSLEDLDQNFHSLYTEKDGKFSLTGIEGIKTQADVDYVKQMLTKERDSHKKTKDKYSGYADMNLTAEELHEKLDRFDELESAAGGNIDSDKIAEMVEARLKTKTAPFERELDAFKKEMLAKDNVISEFQLDKRNRSISDHVRKAAVESKLIGTAVEDALTLAERMFEVDELGAVVTKDNVGVTPGVDAAVWLTDMQKSRPHWWANSLGGGATGSGQGVSGNNPFSKQNWNLTEQGKLLTSDPTQATQMAKAAGTTIGGGMPSK